MKYFIPAFCCVLAVGCNEAAKPGRTDVTVKKPVSEDNHGVSQEKSDVANASKTPLDQKQDSTDLQITADIRKRIMDSKMSVEAQNVKVISAGGIVTLRGAVKTAAEKDQIEKIAKEFAGEQRVENQLELDAPK